MMKYHIKKDGTPGICYATTKPCPLGGPDKHYNTEEEAMRVSQETFEREMGVSSHYDEDRVANFIDYAEDDPREARLLWTRMTEADKVESAMRFVFSDYNVDKQVDEVIHKNYIKRFNEDYREYKRGKIEQEQESGGGPVGYVRPKADADLYSGDFSDMSEAEFAAADQVQQEYEEKYRQFFRKGVAVDTFLKDNYPEIDSKVKTVNERVDAADKVYKEYSANFENFQKTVDPNYNWKNYNYKDDLHNKFREFMNESR